MQSDLKNIKREADGLGGLCEMGSLCVQYEHPGVDEKNSISNGVRYGAAYADPLDGDDEGDDTEPSFIDLDLGKSRICILSQLANCGIIVY